MKASIEKSYIAFDNNLVVKDINKISHSKINSILAEYTAISTASIHLLLETRIRTYEWEDLRKELDNNIAEEYGSQTKGIPHLAIMRKGWQDTLWIDIDKLEYTKNTQEFLSNMTTLFKNEDNAFLAGAVLALEATAIPEFKVLSYLVDHYCDRQGIKKCKSIQSYIDGHLIFEVGHEARLNWVIEPYINDGNRYLFKAGYSSVVLHMQNWWTGIWYDFCR